jgi:protein TonB
MGYRYPFLVSLLVHALLLWALLGIDIRPEVSREVVLNLETLSWERPRPKAVQSEPKPRRRTEGRKKLKKANKVQKKPVRKENLRRKGAEEKKEVKAPPPPPPPPGRTPSGVSAPEEPPEEPPKEDEVQEYKARRPAVPPPPPEPPAPEEGPKVEPELVKEIVERFLVYPPLARRMGWEGTVVLRVVLSEGGLEEVRVERSSGYRILDRSALKAVMRASGELPKVEGTVVLIIPVNYRLE